jgi:hypothetical protein
VYGEEYKDATVSRVEPDGIVLRTKSGISKVYFVELPKEVQERFHYDAASAAQFTTVQQAVIEESNAAVAAQQQEQAQERQRRAVEIAQQQQQAEQQQRQADAILVRQQQQVQAQHRQAAQSNRHVGGGVSPHKRSASTHNQWQIEEQNRIANENERRKREYQEQDEAYRKRTDAINHQNQANEVKAENARRQREHESWQQYMQSSEREYQRLIRDMSHP